MQPEGSNGQLNVTLEEAIKIVTRNQDRGTKIGRFLDESFEHINAVFFDGKLPRSLILVELSAYGKCVGSVETKREDFPRILIHPVTLKRGGLLEAYCVLLHECMHVNVEDVIGGWRGKVKGDSSHNNEIWCGEVNRIAPILGLENVRVDVQRVERVDGHPRRVEKGNVALKYFSRFPYSMPDAQVPLAKFFRDEVQRSINATCSWT